MLFRSLTLNDKVKLSEKISGDSSFSHSLAFCQALEKLSDTVVPARARYLRVIYAELERLANHFGDIWAIMMDTGFNFGGAQGSRLREMLMQINEGITGSRFLRGVNVIGGVTKDIDNLEKKKLSLELKTLSKDFSEVIGVALNSTSLLNRLKGTGVLSTETAKNYGVIGVAGKAVGIINDARVDYPYAAYDELLFDEIVTEQDGDVYARFLVRIKEAHASIKIMENALEKLGDTVVPARARYLRVIYAELERLANHFGDIGAIMMDTGFNFGGAGGTRLREMVMQINERITGSRFLRSVNIIGGLTKDIDDREKNKLFSELKNLSKDFSEVIGVALNSTSLLNRLKGTGILSAEIAKNHGVVGVAGKAVGIINDARVNFPYAAYDELLLDEIVTEQDGDACARFLVRIKEARASIKIMENASKKLPKGHISIPNPNVVFKKNTFAICVVEGWRGEILYFVTTDAKGNISRVTPRDPSFINWAVLCDAGFDNVIPDFPLINKSFNLSYSGNDL